MLFPYILAELLVKELFNMFVGSISFHFIAPPELSAEFLENLDFPSILNEHSKAVPHIWKMAPPLPDYDSSVKSVDIPTLSVSME